MIFSRPEKVVAEIRERWLTAIEQWLDARDLLKRLQLTQGDFDQIVAEFHRKAGLEEAARLVDQWGRKENIDVREIAAIIRKST